MGVRERRTWGGAYLDGGLDVPPSGAFSLPWSVVRMITVPSVEVIIFGCNSKEESESIQKPSMEHRQKFNYWLTQYRVTTSTHKG
jgi:hypothetical protein